MDQEGQSGQGSNAKFNGGMLKVMRLHELARTANLAKMNLLAMNMQLGIYNYQVVFESMSIYYDECDSHCSDEERKTAMALHDALQNFIDTNPISKIQTKINSGGQQVILQIPEWKVFRSNLGEYDRLVRHYAHIHKLDSKSVEEDEEGWY